MSVGATIVVAVVSGIGGTSLGAWLGARNNRREHFRERLMDAADDLVHAGSDAVIVAGDAIYRVDQGPKNADAVISDDAKAVISDAWTKRATVLRLTSRVELLFGPTSETAEAARSLWSMLGDTIDTVQKTRDSPTSDVPAAKEKCRDAEKELTKLQQTALKAIRTTTPP